MALRLEGLLFDEIYLAIFPNQLRFSLAQRVALTSPLSQRSPSLQVTTRYYFEPLYLLDIL